MENIKPRLIEPITKYYTNYNLKNVRIFKDKWINFIVNIIVFLLFIGTIGGILYFRYKGKPNEEEIEIKKNREKMYIFEKLHKYQYEKNKDNENLITNLPII